MQHFGMTSIENPNMHTIQDSLGNMSFKLNDGLVHVISDCPTYRVEQQWKLDDSW